MRQYFELPRAIYFICFGIFINRAGSFIVPFLTIYLSQKLGFGDLFATQAMGLFGMGAVFGALVGGYLADHIGRRFVMLLALFGSGTMMLILSRQQNGAAILVCVAGLAFIADMYRPAAQAMMADLVEPARRPYAFTLIYVSINLGFAVGPALGGLLLRFTSFDVLFWGDAGTSFLYGLIVLLLLKETIHHAHREMRAARDAQRVGPAPADAATAPLQQVGVLEAFGRILADTNFMLLCAATLLVSLVYMQAMSTFPLYARRFGIDAPQFGRIVAINGILIVALQIPLTHFVRRFDRGMILVFAAGLIALGFGLKGVATTATAFSVCVVIWTLGEMLQVPVMGPLISELAPPDLRARYMGVFSMCHSGANMIAAPIGGIILTKWGGTLWQITAVAAAMAAVFFWLACWRVKHRPRTALLATAATSTRES